MLIETTDAINSPSSASSADDVVLSDQQFETLGKQIASRRKECGANKLYGAAAKRGAVYRWGVAVAIGRECDELTETLSRLACDRKLNRRNEDSVDLVSAAHCFVDWSNERSAFSAIDAARVVLWGAAMPALSQILESATWCRVVSTLQQLRESILQQSNPYSAAHLMIGGELGLTFATRLTDMSSCERMHSSSCLSIAQWCEEEGESIVEAIVHGTNARLVLASLLRCRRILRKTSGQKLTQQQDSVCARLATWVAAMTTHTGGTAFSDASGKAVADDMPPNGLLSQACKFNPKSLQRAFSAALGGSQTGGRLAWQVNLPDAMHHDAEARIAVMFPDWDVRRGRAHIDYSGEDVRVEVFAGRANVISGEWETMIEVDDQEQQPCGSWDEICEYTDDDVHYLEIEQPWTGGVLLQRQVMLVRDDRCLLLADAVVPDRDDTTLGPIKYASRLPLADTIESNPEHETRELFLSDGRRRGMVMPLSANEWRVGATDATLKQTEDHHLLFSTKGRGRLYAPLWFDFQQRRFERLRTWRTLTVADQLRISGRDEAVGYRVQVGSEQWVVYRSLALPNCRTVLGKHLIADFFSSRFDPSDGDHETLVIVDGSKTTDDG